MKDEKIYYYTDFNTFKLILENGTLRFKESTASNDRMDTVQLYKNLMEMAKTKLKNKDLRAEQEFYFDMLKHNGVKKSRISLVSCFTSKADSRMLWDAYTMHRKDRIAERYNGVCIEINKDSLVRAMENTSELFDIRCCQNIVYGFEKINTYLEGIMHQYSEEVEKLSQEENQEQNIIPPIQIPFLRKEVVLKKCIVIPTIRLMLEIDKVAPFFKHSFWCEECETRALLSIKVSDNRVNNLKKYDDGSAYFDLPISCECFNKVILGPELCEDDIKELKAINGKIKYENLETIISEGTGVITNR